MFGRTHPQDTRRGGLFHSSHGLFRRRNRVAGGYKAALSNPNTTNKGRRRAKEELRGMGRGDEAHVSFMTKVRRTLGIRSTHRRSRGLRG